MKKILLFLTFMSILTAKSYGQITNLLVNGQTSSFTMTSGDQLGWSYDVPTPGDTTLIEIWIDTDQNGVLNPSTDVLWIFFNHIDGDPKGQHGPPDIDGTKNGHVLFQSKLGLAPAHYIMLFKNHNNYKTVTGIVNKLASPAITISGTVSVPPGISKQNIMLTLEAQGNGQTTQFWDALTDANGNFTIQMNADTTGNPWRLTTDNNLVFGSAVLSPMEYEFTLNPNTPNYTTKNFTVTAASAEIKGTARYEDGTPFIRDAAFISWNNGSYYRYGLSDTAGAFRIGLLSTELPQNNIQISAGDQFDTTQMMAIYTFPTVNSGNTLTHDLTIFRSNSTISGKVTLNGNPPNFSLQLSASNKDSASTNLFTDPNGNFVFHVSSKIYNYYIFPVNQPSGLSQTPILVHPGQKNILINFTLTDVKPGGSNIPSEYNLSQNYPNPFNPSTTINYSIARDGNVKLTIYNTIGEKIAAIVDEYKPAGNYSVQFNGSNLPSGIYLYKLESGSFRAAKKFILLK